MDDYLQDARMFARHMEGESNEAGARNAQRAMACALIAIAQELRVMNAHNTGAVELEEAPPSEAEETRDSEDGAWYAIEHDLPY